MLLKKCFLDSSWRNGLKCTAWMPICPHLKDPAAEASIIVASTQLVSSFQHHVFVWLSGLLKGCLLGMLFFFLYVHKCQRINTFHNCSSSCKRNIRKDCWWVCLLNYSPQFQHCVHSPFHSFLNTLQPAWGVWLQILHLQKALPIIWCIDLPAVESVTPKEPTKL